MKFDLEQMGLNKEKLQERLIKSLVEDLLYNDDRYIDQDKLEKKVLEKVKQSIDKKIDQMSEKLIHPNISQFIEQICLEETNQWGEKKGKKYTFIEYLIQRANHYLEEKVDYNGNSKSENRYSNWSGQQTRITYLVHKHLQFSIEKAMEQALKTANEGIVSGLEQTVKMKMKEISEGLKVDLRVKK